jgi:ABC-type multidrug transport system ATPase subunit
MDLASLLWSIYQDSDVNRSVIYRHLSIASPYTSLIEDFSLEENFKFYKNFKTLQKEVTYKQLLSILQWKDPVDKPFAKFSSGMKQKATLIFAFLSDSPFLLLDEPTSFLDLNAREWYKENFLLFNTYKTVIIASNDVNDFINATESINL